MRRAVSAAALLLALAGGVRPGAARAQEEPHEQPAGASASAADAPPLDARQLVSEAQAAFARGDAEPFAALVAAIAADPVLDPWIFADAWLACGAADVAKAFAAAGSGPRWDGLPAYLATEPARAPRRAEYDARLAFFTVAGDDERVIALTDEPAAAPLPHTCLALELLRSRGAALAAVGRGEEAAALARRVAERCLELGWTAGALEASMVEGQALQDPLDVDALRSAYARAADLAHRLQSWEAEGQALTNVAVAHYMEGQYSDAAALLERASAAFDRAPRSSALQVRRLDLLMNRGELSLRLGEAAEARAALDRAHELLLAASTPLEPHDREARIRRLLAAQSSACLLTGDVDGASAAQRELASRAAEDRDPLASGRAAGALGAIRGADGDWHGAREAYSAAADHFAAVPDETLRLRAGLLAAYCLVELGRSDAALAALREGIDAATALPDREVIPHAQRELGRALLDSGDVAGALPVLRSARDAADALGQRSDLVSARCELARALLASHDPAGALAEARLAVDALPPLVRDVALSEAASTRQRWARCYDVGLRAALALRDADAALYFVEAGRAGALLDGLRGRTAFARASLPPELLARTDLLRRDRASAELALREAVCADSPLALRAERRIALASAVRAEREATERLGREGRIAARLVYPSPAAASAIRAALREHEALVLYRVLPDLTIALVLTGSGLRLAELPSADVWRDDVRLLRPSGGAGTAARAAALDRLRAALVVPLALDVAVKRVLVAPDGGLTSAPLGELFGERACAFVPSGSLLCDLRALPACTNRDALALGDPVYTPADRLVPLPGTRAEVADIAEPKTELLGTDATPAALFAALARPEPWRVVHIASHGVVDRGDPWESALALSSSADAPGRASALDLAAQRISADLVTLSACDLGGARVVEGEGAVGVPQALLVAGARCVLANLWRADDAAAARLMHEFYAAWRDGDLGAAEALRRAQKVVAADPRWHDERFWAGWVLWGAPD